MLRGKYDRARLGLKGLKQGHLLRIIILGDGQVGTQLAQDLLLTDHTTSLFGSPRSTKSKRLDLHDLSAIQRVVRLHRPQVIVNAAAFTDVSRAESEPYEAYRTNCLVIEHLSSFGIPLIHFSTDFVYSGSSDVPYKETDATEPISVYGRTKLLGDQALAKSGTPHINLRTSWVYGPTGNNFVRKILSLLETREEIFVVTDEVSAPTSVKSLSSIVLAILNQPDSFIAEHSGVYHACDKGFMSRYEMAKEIQDIAKDLGFAHKATRITGEGSSASSIRPKNSRLDTAKLESLLPGALVDAKVRLQNVLYDIFMLYHN